MKIISMCPAGLGNRIKCMISTIKMRERVCHYEPDCGATYVYWPVNKQCGCKFDDIFEPFIREIALDKISKKDILNKSWKLLSGDKEFDFKYNNLTQKEKDEFSPYFKFIKPKREIEDTAWAFMNKYKESFDKGEVIGVHIRKGDFSGLYDGRQHISTEDKFISKIYDLLILNENYKFLICTEDEETENTFRDIFGNAIINFPKRYRGRNTPNSIKEAFVDMLLLSKCNIILGTFLSTFTEVAWWLGGCKAQVVIVGGEDKEAVAEVLSKLPQVGESIYKKILRRFKIWKTEGI